MRGMDEVGRLFNSNQLIVAEVLQSAEAMKAAVAQLEPHMEKTESSSRGKILLATVKGDVHDIGKNLVEIILANNGFEVVNLGIKVPPEQLIAAVKQHQPQIIGLSGLLVKSAQQMVATAEDFSRAGVATPMLVGGAALSSGFVDKQIAKAYAGTVAYASDAMAGLDLAKRIVSASEFETLKKELEERRAKIDTGAKAQAAAPAPVSEARSTQIPALTQVPSAPDQERHVLKNTPIEQIWKYINPLMLYGRHLGIKGGTVRLLEKSATDAKARREVAESDPKSLRIWEAVEEVKETYKGKPEMAPSAVYRFFPASARGNAVRVFDVHVNGKTAVTELARFEFPRQRKADGFCLSDYVAAMPEGGIPSDTMAAFVVSVGKGVRAEAEKLKAQGDYLKSHIIQALALESAEAYAEWLHALIRKAWGFPDTPEMKMIERFQAKYRGKRYSFGYPACPRLDDQAILWKLLNPNEIGVDLTEGFMMDPESSVSAIVFHHPQATYFSVGEAGLEDQRGS
jgi:5-methyltetrahydrofolate--homocysteine methyltransferase